jgi:hypothetical protein
VDNVGPAKLPGDKFQRVFDDLLAVNNLWEKHFASKVKAPMDPILIEPEST